MNKNNQDPYAAPPNAEPADTPFVIHWADGSQHQVWGRDIANTLAYCVDPTRIAKIERRFLFTREEREELHREKMEHMSRDH